MSREKPERSGLARGLGTTPALPLWQLAPTRGDDGRSLADFMMLIPGLAARPQACRERVTAEIRAVCESYGGRVAFADINLAINVLWVSVAAEPGLAGQVARSIRRRVPDALLVGGQLGAAGELRVAPRSGPLSWWNRMSRRASALLAGPRQA